jgi:hypothetical protein
MRLFPRRRVRVAARRNTLVSCHHTTRSASRQLIALGISTALGLTVSGCTSADGHTASSASQPPVLAASGESSAPPLETADGLSLPIEQYLVRTSASHVINLADLMLVRNCMAKYGFSYAVPTTTSVMQTDTDGANMSRRYGITDASVAAQWGYEEPPTQNSSADDVNQVTSLSDAEYIMLWGHSKASNTATVSTLANGTAVPAGGCMGVARSQLSKHDNLASSDPAEQIDDESFANSQSDPRVADVFSAWSRCMAASGYNLKTPLDAMATYAGAASPSHAEISQALTDISCKNKTKLIQTWVGVETSIQDQLIAQNQTALTQDTDAENQLIKYAESIIA